MSHMNTTNSTNFRLQIQDNKATDAFVMNIQRAILPASRITVIDMPAMRGVHRQSVPGSATEFDPLVVTVIVDENLNAYFDIYNWMLKINNYITGKSLTSSESTANMLYHIMDNNKRDIIATVEFKDAWPSELGELEYSYTDEGNTVITCTVMFQYKSFVIERAGTQIRG